METITKLAPKIQSENDSEESTQSEECREADLNDNFDSCSSSPINPGSIPESIISSLDHELLNNENNTIKISQEEENYGMVYNYPQQRQRQRQQRQQHRLELPMLDTASYSGSEPPIVEGRGPSSIDNLQSTRGGPEYVLNNQTMASLKKSSEEDVASVMESLKKSLTENNAVSRPSDLEKENELLKEQLKKSQQKCKGLSERIRNLTRHASSTEEALQLQIDDLKEQLKREKEPQKDAEEYKNQITKLEKAAIEREKIYTEKINEILEEMARIKKEHKKEASAWIKSNKTLTKKNSKLQSMVESSDLDQSTSSTNDGDFTSFSISSSFDAGKDDEENKSFVPARYFDPSDSKLATTHVRFEEGMVKFIEGKNSSSELYKNSSYEEWYKDMIKIMDKEIIYQSSRHLFLRREFDEALTSDDRRLSFSSLGPPKLSFEKMKCIGHEFCENGWPEDTDHMLVLHPTKAELFKELLQFSKEDVRGKIYSKWSSQIDPGYFYEIGDEYKTYLLCAYKNEKK